MYELFGHCKECSQDHVQSKGALSITSERCRKHPIIVNMEANDYCKDSNNLNEKETLGIKGKDACSQWLT